MRHFSGEFEGVRLLMADELDMIAGGDGEDTDDVQEPQEPAEIVVNGIRQDQVDRNEQLMERQWTSYFAQFGSWVNAEYINNQWYLWQADNPTEDQKRFKNDYDQIRSTLWGHLDESQSTALASSLTDRGINLGNGSNGTVNIGSAWSNYQTLLNNGTVTGRTSDDFAQWIANGGR